MYKFDNFWLKINLSLGIHYFLFTLFSWILYEATVLLTVLSSTSSLLKSWRCETLVLSMCAWIMSKEFCPKSKGKLFPFSIYLFSPDNSRLKALRDLGKKRIEFRINGGCFSPFLFYSLIKLKLSDTKRLLFSLKISKISEISDTFPFVISSSGLLFFSFHILINFKPKVGTIQRYLFDFLLIRT